ncbi:MAG: hypothetical protein VB959_22090 [Rhodospirillales bacterium]
MADTPTAGFRNAEWTMDGLPDGTQVSVQTLRTFDNAACNGFLYWRGKPDTAVCIMHPREFLATHYLIPAIVEAGFAAWTQTTRSVGSDLRLEHERALLDVAAGQVKLREMGIDNVVLLGNSGGASLYSFYNSQALLEPEARLTQAPGGRAVDLAGAPMPPPDAFAFVSPHPGQGAVLLNAIDASVTDEADPLSVDAGLDPFAADNGFRAPPESAAYSAGFQERYRKAQRARVQRLDETARALIEERLDARCRAKDGGYDRDKRLGAWNQVMTIWRTDADLRNFDLSLDPSGRRYGSVWGANPLASNYGNVGFARLCSPEAWLSTWSGLASNAEMAKTLSAVQQPALFIDYTGDTTSFPADMDAMFDQLGSAEKVRHRVPGDHHGRPLTEDEPAGREAAGRLLGDWLRQHFPPA